MRKEAILALGLAACIIGSSPAGAATAQYHAAMDSLATPAKQFAEKCLAHVFSGNDLNTRLSGKPEYLEYTPEQAARFLMGSTGKAWGFRSSEDGNFVVALLDNGICRLFAQTADTGTAQRDLDTLVTALFPGFPVGSISGTRAGPQGEGVVSSGRYPISTRNKDKTPLYFVTTSTNPATPFEAMYWIAFGDPDATAAQGAVETDGH